VIGNVIKVHDKKLLKRTPIDNHQQAQGNYWEKKTHFFTIKTTTILFRKRK